MPKLINGLTIPLWVEDLTTPFGIANSLFCGRVVRDRFNVLNQYSQINWDNSVDKIPSTTEESLANLMDRRANELIGNSITVQWSGGVDSTSLLLSLIKNGISKEDLVIRYDENSCAEYPMLYKWLVDNKYQMKPVVNDWFKALSTADTDLIVNGWCADQLFGSVFFYSCPELYSVDLKTLLDSVSVEKVQATEEQKNLAIEVYKKYAKDLFDLELTTAAELGWFINFTVKWSYVSLFNEMYLAGTSKQFITKPFYDTHYFQSWAISNFQNISKANMYSEPKEYKKALKEYCNSIFPDQEYLTTKSKKPSWKAREDKTMYKKRRIVLKTTEGYEIYQAPSLFISNKVESLEQAIFTKFKK